MGKTFVGTYIWNTLFSDKNCESWWTKANSVKDNNLRAGYEIDVIKVIVKFYNIGSN